MNIVLAADHAGFEMKERIREHLAAAGHAVDDVGAHRFSPTDDYPRYMHALADRVLRTPESFGIMFGGSGQGEAIVANRHAGIRAIVYPSANPDIIAFGRGHNDANVLSVGARFVTDDEARAAVDAFLAAPFSYDERHCRRIRDIDAGMRPNGMADMPPDAADTFPKSV